MEKSGNSDFFSNIQSSLVQPDRASIKRSGKLTYTVFYLLLAVVVLTIFGFYAEYTFLRNAFVMISTKANVAFNIYRALMVVSAVIFVLTLKPKILNRVLYFLMPLTALGLIGNFLSFKYLNNGFLNVITLIIIVIGLGAFLASSITLFLNFISSYERIIIISIAFLCVNLILPLLKNFTKINNFFGSFAVPLLCLLISIFAMYFVSREHFRDVQLNNEKIPNSLFIIMTIMFVLFVVYELAFIVLKTNILVPKYKFNYTVYYISIFISSLLGIVLFWCFKYSNLYYIIIWTLSVILLSSFGLLMIISNGTLVIKAIFEIMSGFTTANGFIMSFMLIGKILEDKASLKLYRFVILILGSLFVIFEILFAFITFSNAALVFIIMEMVAVAVLIIVVIMLFIAIHNMKTDNSIKKVEIGSSEETNENEFINPYKVLTNKEIIVFEQLLLGNTLRQIAGELRMKYNTVNFHYKNIYRKLDVNSRIELIVRYGKK